MRGEFLIKVHLRSQLLYLKKATSLLVHLYLPVKDQSPRDQDILQVTDVVRGDAEVVEVVSLVVVRDLRKVERLQHTALHASHYCSPRYM